MYKNKYLVIVCFFILAGMHLTVSAQPSASIVIEVLHRLSTILRHLSPSTVSPQLDIRPTPDPVVLQLREDLHRAITIADRLDNIDQLHTFLHNNPKPSAGKTTFYY